MYTQNLAFAKEFFRKSIVGLQKGDLEVLYRKVTQGLLFNIFTISSEVEVCVAFETMNNRGKPLSYLELLKNRLIYLSLKFEEEEYERDSLRKAINNCWRAIYHNLGRNKDRPLDDDKFLWAHYMTYFGLSQTESGNKPLSSRATIRRLSTSYTDNLLNDIFVTKNIHQDAPPSSRVTLRDVYQYVNSLQDSVETWFNIFNPFQSDFSQDVRIWLDKIIRIGIDAHIPTALVAIRTVSNDRQLLAFLQAVERYLFVTSLVSPYYRVNVGMWFDPTASLLAADLNAGKTTIEKTTKHYVEMTNTILKQEIVKSLTYKFKSVGFYDWQMTRYFLYEYDLSLRESSKTERAKIHWPEFTEDKADFVSVEHIYPQSALDEYWVKRFNHHLPRRRIIIKNSLGNLLPLAQPKNSSLSNKAFPEKARGVPGSTVSYAFGSYAENEVAQLQDWTPEAILSRGLKLLTFMETRWNLNLGDRKEKINLLGLGFLEAEAQSS